MASSADLTFQPGALLPPREEEGEGGTSGGNSSSSRTYSSTAPGSKYFDIESCEVWGVGGDEVVLNALRNRHKQRGIVASNILRKARKVNKAQFLDDFKIRFDLKAKPFRCVVVDTFESWLSISF